MNMSIWNINENNRKINILNKNIELDILIIGAGMTGMTTAYYLKDKEKVGIVDSNLYGHGVTLNSTAKITYLQERIYSKIKSIVNESTSYMYLKSQMEAIESIKSIIEKENIECDLKKTPSYIFANTKKEFKKLEKEVELLKSFNIDIKEEKLPEKITSYKSYKVYDTYTFNPIKYLDGIYNIIKDKIPIYEKTQIKKIELKDKYYCYIDDYYIKANKVIIACHYPFFLFPFFLPIRSSIEKSYMIISKVDKNPNYSLISTSYPTYSCRYYENNNQIYQISLSESHNTAFKQNDLYHFKRVKEIFDLDEKNIIMSYSNVDILTHDHMPYIGKIKNNMYISTGYSTWGMTNSIIGAKIISDLINNKENQYTKIFNPLRKNLAFFINIPKVLFLHTKAFIGPKINKNKNWYKNKIKFKGSKASYQDNIINNKCPHMGCSLIFNMKEKTWDCPCHSSRFDISGKCIKGPSLKDVSKKVSNNINK